MPTRTATDAQSAPPAAPTCNETTVPNRAHIAGFIDMAVFVPVDDKHHIIFQMWRSKKGETHDSLAELHDGKVWWDMTEEEHQASPGDYEAQSSMPGPASSYEHLSPGDVAIGIWRRRLEAALADIAEGRDPPGVNFNPDAPPYQTQGFTLRPMEAA